MGQSRLYHGFKRITDHMSSNNTLLVIEDEDISMNFQHEVYILEVSLVYENWKLQNNIRFSVHSLLDS